MALKETLTPLKATNNATYKTVEGVTYFKLKSEFEGDYTKHCGLLGEEIDENFYFLRGYDIEDIIVDENSHLLGALGIAIISKKYESDKVYSFDVSDISFIKHPAHIRYA